MARIALELPEVWPFETRLHIRITDLNYGAHLGNDRVLAFLHEARARYLAQWGITETDAYGVGMAMVDAAIQFRAEGFFGDEVLARVAVGDITAKSWDFLYRLELPGRDKVLALAKTGMVAFDYRERRVTRIPEELLARLRQE